MDENGFYFIPEIEFNIRNKKAIKRSGKINKRKNNEGVNND